MAGVGASDSPAAASASDVTFPVGGLAMARKIGLVSSPALKFQVQSH